MNPLLFLLRDQSKLESQDPLEAQLFEPTTVTAVPSSELLTHSDFFCKSCSTGLPDHKSIQQSGGPLGQRIEKARAASHLCLDDKQLLCYRCAAGHFKEGHHVLDVDQVANKSRATIVLMQQEIAKLIQRNRTHIHNAHLQIQ